MTNYSRSVLKSNGLHHSKNLPEKFGFLPIDTPANIAKKLPPQRCSKPLFIAFFSLSHKRPTFAFTGESGYTLGFRRRIAHSGLHGETGGVSDGGGIITLGAFRTFTNIPGPGVRTANFAAFGAWSGVLPKNAGSLGIAMRSCASLFRGVAAPLGCVICLQLGDVAVFSLCAQYFLNVRGRGVLLPSERSTRFGNPARPGGRMANFAAFGAWSETLPKNTESLRDSDALMRVAVPRRRGPAGLRDLFRFCRSCGLYALFQILLSVLKAVELVLLLCKLRLGSFLFGSELFKGFRFCHCA